MPDIFAIADLVAPWAGLIIGIVGSLMAKDWTMALAKGLLFKWDPMFAEGDTVIIDGERAVIVKIGLTRTTFAIDKPSGDQAWRFVHNSHVNELKLEKIVREARDN